MANPPCATGCHTVFVDTSLDTHMAMVVEDVDTVADFKRKIQREHALCFPDIGEIGINALQVKRKGFLYHLSDSMYVRSAFDGVKSRWFVYVEACRMVKQGLEIVGPFPKANGVLYLERNGLEDRVDDQLNEADKSLRIVHKDDCLNGKDNGKAAGDVVVKVLEALEIEFEHMGDDHCRASSSDTNRRVESEFDGGNVPNDGSGQIKQLGKKRKIDDSENPVDKTLLNGNSSSGRDDETITAKKKRKVNKKEKGSSKQSYTKTNNATADESDKGERDGDTIEKPSVTYSHEALHSVPFATARLEPENEPMHEDPVKDQIHVNRLPIAPTNALSNGEDALHYVLANEDSPVAKTNVDGKQFSRPDATAASVSEVPTEKSEPGTKQKKKKTKSKTLQNHLPTEVPVPAENNDCENLKDTTGLQVADAADKVNLKTLGAQNMEDALHEFPTNQICSIDKNTLLPRGPEKMPLENQKLADLREYDNVVEAPEMLRSDGDRVSMKSRKKAKKEKKGSDSHKRKKTKPVTESVETTEVGILCNPNAENTGSKSERTNVSHLMLDVETNEVAEGATNVLVTDGSDMQVVKAREANLKASQLKDSSNLKNPMPLVEKEKEKSKKKRISATNPSEIQLQEKVVNPSQSIAGADKGEIETAEKNNDKKDASVGIFTETAHALQVEGKHLDSVVGTNLSVDDNRKDNKLSSATEEINFGDSFVARQQKPEVVASGDAGNVDDERIPVKDKTADSIVKKKPTVVQDGKKSQVENSQESLSMGQPHGALLHSDTESFRVPKDRTPSNSGKQKSKSSNKKSKQISSEVATPHSPIVSETQKSNFSHEATKLYKTQSQAVSRHQFKENAETLSASNSTLKSHGGVQRTKSKEPASKKSNNAIKKADNAAKRRKTLLSANIFKDDNDESSEDEKAVESGRSTGTHLDDLNDSDMSEMEDDTGFATPITVGQRKAAEADSDSSLNKYTLEMLRESARLEKAKRAQELGIPPEEFVMDSQADQIS